ncbi:MAG: DUF1361 domain-containing protein [Candidatus Levybacteria bacterium]|nr:DUF1361 domain-containing protein [Candidatus Levybacteria bacterium]
MNILFYNTFWITGNISLGIIAVVLGWLTLKVKSPMKKAVFGFLWLLFIPNTIYMLTDIIHFQNQFLSVEGSDKIILVLQYNIIILAGFATFLFGLYPIEKILLKRYKKRKYVRRIIVMTNFVIAFGLVIGRIQRTNSWEVFTNFAKVLQDSINVLTSIELMMLVLFFGIFNNLIYFLLRQLVRRYGGK